MLTVVKCAVELYNFDFTIIKITIFKAFSVFYSYLIVYQAKTT